MLMLQERLNQSPAGGSGGFKLDVEQMRTLLPQWKDLVESLSWLRQNAQNLRQVLPPAGDESSTGQNQAALAHSDLYQSSVEEQYNYAAGYVDSLQKMIAKYEHSDGSASHALNIMGTDL
jgi:hypothetical protein